MQSLTGVILGHFRWPMEFYRLELLNGLFGKKNSVRLDRMHDCIERSAWW